MAPVHFDPLNQFGKSLLSSSHLRRRHLLAAAAAGLAPRALLAQEAWKPSKPIKIVVPFSAGGGADLSSRLFAKGVSERLGQPVFVENRTGASGSIGSDYVFNAPPDGYTLLAGTPDAQAVNPQLVKQKIDNTRFVPLSGMTSSGYLLLGRATLPASTLKELVALASSTSLTYGSAGAGSTFHVLTAAFGGAIKAKELRHIPYQGASVAMTALLAGEIDLMMLPDSVAMPYIGRTKVFGMTTAKRKDAFADVPTLREQGVNLVAESWSGIFAPPGTPPHIATALASAFQSSIQDPAVLKQLKDSGRTPLLLSNAQFAEFYRNAYADWGRMIATSGIKLE